MKVLLINKVLYPKGGDAVATLSTGELLRDHGHEVFFWGMKSGANPFYEHENLFVEEMDFNLRHGIREQLKMGGNVLYSFEAKRKVEKLIQSIGKPDIVHLHNFAHQISPSILHLFKKYNIPCVMTMHDYKLVCPVYALVSNGKLCDKCTGGNYYMCVFNRCTKYSYAKSLLNTAEMYLHHRILHIYDLIDTYIAPSLFMKSKCEEMQFKKRIVYLPNFVKTGEFVPKYAWNENSIVYVGRLSSEKGLLTLIEAMAKNPNVTLKLIGEGTIGEDLKRRVRERSLGNIRFLGYKIGDDLKIEVQNSMFSVLASECYENNPRSIIETFALGKPALGSRIGGIGELVREGETGFTFEAGNTNDLGSKIEYLVNNPVKIIEMGKNARRFVEKELSAQKHYERLMKIYEQVIIST